MFSNNIYYVYFYLRSNFTPYYVGKGKHNRAWNKNHSTLIPKDKSKIIIVESDLTELQAFILERYYIRWFGRKNIQTGILRNLTDGGEGTSGRILSDITKYKCGSGFRGKTAWNKGKKQPHKKHKARKDKGTSKSTSKPITWITGFKQKISCPYCNKLLDRGNFAKYHGDKCSLKN